MNDDTLLVRVARRTLVTEDVVSLLLESVSNALPAFEAGAHIDLHLGPGLVRQYSLCNATTGCAGYELGVLLTPDSRGGGLAAHALREGDEVRIGKPRNLFPLATGDVEHLLLAGGIGITPILSMADVLHRQGASFTLHACARSADRQPFLARLREAEWSARVTTHTDDGSNGAPHDFGLLISRLPPGGHVYACGPAGFIDAASRAAAAAGLATSQFHSESFSATHSQSPGDAFEIELNDGRVLEVAADQTVAQCLEAHGIFIALSCEQGICGTCVTPLLDGVPDHRDSYLTDEEKASNQMFTPCCSRALTSRLVLDLTP